MVVDGKMPFPLSRSIAIPLPLLTLPLFIYIYLFAYLLTILSLPYLDLVCLLTMADVQTNLLSYIITKLHSDVASIERLIRQVHTGQYSSVRRNKLAYSLAKYICFPDVEYLLQARQISSEDARLILSKVPQPIHVDPAPAPPTGIVLAGSSLQLTTLPTPILNSNVQPVASPPAPPLPPQLPLSPAATAAIAKRAVPPPPKKVQARALWDYNIDDDVRVIRSCHSPI